MDCDTAFKGGWVGAMATDLVRAERLKEQGMNLDYLTATDLNWQLLSSRSSRVKRLSQMEDKMVAMTRYSATAMLADELVDTSGVVNEHVFRIQVNSIFVRLSMLETQVMDLLLLPEPQATVARNMESPVLYDTRWNNVSMGVVVMNDTTIADATLRKSQREAFLNAYNEACDSLNELGLKRYRDIIMKRCRVTPAVVDSLPSDIQFTPAHQPFQQDVDRAVKWLNMQY
jgi:NitT/TauT family transport system substrate-binding protein